MKYQYLTVLFQRAAKGFSNNGISGLAQVMGKSPNVLSNKLNPDCFSNNLSLEEAAQVIELTRETCLVNALAGLLDRTTVPLPDDSRSFEDVLEHHIQLTAQNGELGRRILDAKNPQSEWGERISPREQKQIVEKARELAQSCMTLINLYEGK